MQNALDGHCVAAYITRGEEITVTVPGAVVVFHCMGNLVVIALKLDPQKLELDAFALFGIDFGFLNFTDHPIVHNFLLLSAI